MTTKNTGGPAFPVWELNGSGEAEMTGFGITIRDYFAAKAMQALMPIYWEVGDEYEDAEELIDCQVEAAYEYADAMLKARE